MTDTVTGLKRITRTYRQTINASPDDVFPLLCPVREAEWLEGWRYTMLFSRSGLVEEGAVFTTPGDDEARTVWIVTRHDTADRVVEFTRFTPDSRVCVLRVGVVADGEGRSLVDIVYTYTSISGAGDAFLDRFTEDSFRGAMKFWEDSMNHWLETGERLARAS
jgi:ribosome modulation factor